MPRRRINTLPERPAHERVVVLSPSAAGVRRSSWHRDTSRCRRVVASVGCSSKKSVSRRRTSATPPLVAPSAGSQELRRRDDERRRNRVASAACRGSGSLPGVRRITRTLVLVFVHDGHCPSASGGGARDGRRHSLGGVRRRPSPPTWPRAPLAAVPRGRGFVEPQKCRRRAAPPPAVSAAGRDLSFCLGLELHPGAALHGPRAPAP